MTVLHFPARTLLAGCITLAVSVSASNAHAAMGTIASSYGILPGDVASAQSLSLFNPDVSAVYYNPGQLVADPRGELTVGGSYIEHYVEAESLGGNAPLDRRDENLPIDESRQVLLGMKTNLSSLTKVEHPLNFGLMLGVEKYARELLAFRSATSIQGQYVRYGSQPLFLVAGAGTRLVRGLDGGLSFRVTLNANASLKGQSDLAGNTQYEELTVSATPKVAPIVGGTLDFKEAFCDDKDCWLSGWEGALTWRGDSMAETRAKANVVIPGTVPPPGLSLALATIDSYQPEGVTAGLQYKGSRVRVGLTGEWQRWSKLEHEFSEDTVRDQAKLQFKDVIIPRLGMEVRLGDSYRVTAGVAWEESALESDRSLDVNYLDNDRWVIGLGLGAEFRDPPILAFPLRLDIAYQHQILEERRFMLMSSQYDGGASPYEELQTSGHVHAVTASLTLKF